MRKPPLQDVIVKPSLQRAPGYGEPHDRYDDIRPVERPVERSADVRRSPGDEGRPVRVARQAPSREVYAEDEPDNRSFGRPPQGPPLRSTHEPYDRGGRRWLWVALSVGAVVIVSAVALSYLFAGATVTVYPKQDRVVVDTSFTTASGDAASSSGAMPFQRMMLERTAQQTVVAQGEQQVEDRASGTLTIYNNYSDTPVRLIKNTRFQSAAGKIYRIRESVEVPGKKASGTPGSVDVTVFAEAPGEEYNTGPGDFSIPGFVGAPQEGKVYARAADAITGGMVGTSRTVNDTDRQAALATLETQLKDQLLAAAFQSSDIPAGYHLFKEAVFFEFNPLPDESTDTDKVTVSLSGKIHGVLLPEDAFAKRLAQQAIGSYAGTPIKLDNPDDLTVNVSVADSATATSEGDAIQAAWDAPAYTVKVNGNAHFIWQFDEAQLANDLAGKDTSIVDTAHQGGLLQAYPGIDRLQASVRPFWKRTFPTAPKDITVLTELDS